MVRQEDMTLQVSTHEMAAQHVQNLHMPDMATGDGLEGLLDDWLHEHECELCKRSASLRGPMVAFFAAAFGVKAPSHVV